MIPNIPNIEHPERFSDIDLPREKLEYALDEARKKIDYMISYFGDRFPSAASRGNVYPAIENTIGWTTGFYTGMLWHAFEMTGDEKYKNAALAEVPSYLKRIEEKIGVNHHDMGFLYSPSCVAAYKLTGCEDGARAAILAAEHLITRYNEKSKFIQAWGNVGDPNSNRLIIDCLLNIPLLYWASEVTGDQKFGEIALNHFNTTASVIFRPDASTHHTYYFDVETGLPAYGKTKQGASDTSAWSRGQAWGMYGPMLTYTYKKNADAMNAFRAAANYFLNHLPEDYVPFWDLIFTDGDPEERDTSAAGCAVCAMLEAAKDMDDADPVKTIYVGASKRIMASLIDKYLTKDVPEANGLLLHGVYSKPDHVGIDEMCIWGDYFYMEALHRLMDPEWKLYW